MNASQEFSKFLCLISGSKILIMQRRDQENIAFPTLAKQTRQIEWVIDMNQNLQGNYFMLRNRYIPLYQGDTPQNPTHHVQ